MKQFKKPKFTWKRRSGLISGILMFLFSILALLASPIVYASLGWVLGHFTTLIMGQFIADGFNILLGGQFVMGERDGFNILLETNRVDPSHIPLIGATLGFIASFFHNKISANFETKKER